MRSFALSAAFAAALFAPGCGASVMVHRPADPVIDQALTAMWTSEIQRVAKDGDWLLVRSYANAGDFIVTLTTGEEISHAAIYDARRGMVVEALMPEVREIPLERFVKRNRYVILVRPPGSDAERAAAVARARTMIGTGFDLRGMLGIDRPDRFYCAELVYWASHTAERDPSGHWIVAPSTLVKYGQVVYFSGRRDDAQLQRAAAGWAEEHAPIRVSSTAR